MGAKKTSRVGLQQFGVTLPEGVYRDMMDLVEREKRWDGRVEFTREAVREKIEREKSKGGRLSETATRVIRESKPP